MRSINPKTEDLFPFAARVDAAVAALARKQEKLAHRQTEQPEYSAVIDAVARRDKARLLPDGITAANQLGLTDAVPAKVTVHTDARPASDSS